MVTSFYRSLHVPFHSSYRFMTTPMILCDASAVCLTSLCEQSVCRSATVSVRLCLSSDFLFSSASLCLYLENLIPFIDHCWLGPCSRHLVNCFLLFCSLFFLPPFLSSSVTWWFSVVEYLDSCVFLFFVSMVGVYFWLPWTCSDFGAQENIICHCFILSLDICHEVMGPDA